MNIEQANRIPITEILEKIGYKATKQNDKEAWYLSPIRQEKSASFHVDKKKNCWYDFGIAVGGDPVSLIGRYLEHNGFSSNMADVLRWASNLFGNIRFPVLKEPGLVPKDKALEIRNISDVKLIALQMYLRKRGISKETYQNLLKEIRIYNKQTGKYFNAIGIKNEEGGYELRNPLFKGCVGKKSITFIRGTKIKPDGINVFEGFMDYCSARKRMGNNFLHNDTIILNSVSFVNIAIGYIKNYGYKWCYTWLDNDEAGRTATSQLKQFVQTENDLIHFPMNTQYAGFKDVNYWHISTLTV